VAWNKGGSSTAAEPEVVSDIEEAEAAAVEPSLARPGEIDLDAPAAQAQPARAAVAKVAVPEVEEVEEAEEEVVAEPAPAPEAPATDPLALELQKRRAAVKARTLARTRSAAKDKKPSAKKKAVEAESEEPGSEEPAAGAYTGSDPCRAKSFGVPRVRDACASGGRAAAKRVMKDAIGRATATGQSLKCSNCHVDQRDYGLKANALEDLKRWLDGSGE
jgi:hypothetical protein